MPHPVQSQRFPRALSNHVTVELWRRRDQISARILRVYFTKRDLVVIYQ